MPQDCGFPVGCGPRPVCRERSRPFRRALRRGNRADMESAPTAAREVCGQTAAFAAGRGLRRDEGIPPYGCFTGFAGRERRPLLTREPPVGADSISARGVGGGAKRADTESAPTAAREGLRPRAAFMAGRGRGKCGIVVSRTKNIRPQAEAAGVYFTGYWARCQVFCRPAVRAIYRISTPRRYLRLPRIFLT